MDVARAADPTPLPAPPARPPGGEDRAPTAATPAPTVDEPAPTVDVPPPTVDLPTPTGDVPTPTVGVPEVEGAGWEVSWLPPALVAVAVLLVLAFLLGWTRGRRSGYRGLPPGRGPGGRPAPEGGPASPSGAVGLDGTALAESLITLHDLAEDGDGRQRIERLLGRGGVERIPVQPGTAFDDAWHHAVSSVAGPSGPAGMTVDGVVRPGWHVGAWVLRPADVTVRVPTELAGDRGHSASGHRG